MNYTTTISLGNILMIVSVVAGVLTVHKTMLRPILMLVEEHNLMWEDYSLRHGRSYRVTQGRGYSRGSSEQKVADLKASGEFSYSAQGLELTKGFEGLRLDAYQDVRGIWTIGYGHTGADVHEGLVWTQAQADEDLQGDLGESVMCVNAAVEAAIEQCQFDAMVDFCFNCGRGNFLHSTLLRMVNRSDFAGAAAQFGLWVHDGNEVVPGLVRRRAAEAKMFAGE